MIPHDPDSADSTSGSPEEVRLGELINEFFDRRNRGEAVSEESFLAEHPEHAEQLREHLCGLDLISSLGSSSTGQRTIPAGAPARPGGSSSENPLDQGPAQLPQVSGYELVKQVGRGGMGVVFKAVQKSTKRVVALKLLLEGSLASESARRRFEREIALAAQLSHTNIIPIFDSGVAEGRMYYAMEYVHGSALTDYLKAHPLDIPAKLRLFVKICRAVSHAHQRGVVHRDIKPSNVLVDGTNEPHILDFGLAKASVLLDTTTSVTAQIVGTPAYMSPEQAAGDPAAIDTRTDVYSLGVVLQNVAHAEPTPPNKHDSRIDGELTAILLKALEKAKDARYQSVDAFCSDVERYLAGEPITAKPASTLYLLRKVIRHNRLAASVCAMIVLCGAVTWNVAHYLSKKNERTQQLVRQLENQLSEQQNPRAPTAGGQGSGKKPDGDASRRELEWLLQNPDVARILGPMAHELSKSVNNGEDPKVAMIRLLVMAVAEPPSEPGQPLRKTPTWDDLTGSEAGPAPGAPSETPPASRFAIDPKNLDRIRRLLQEIQATGSGGAPPAASQAATSEPAAPDAQHGGGNAPPSSPAG